MKLRELNLQTQKSLIREPSTHKFHIGEWLKARGFHRLGKGEYGAVWTDDRTTVVKVFSRDPCYANFVEFCRQNRGDPHLPRVSNVFWRKGRNTGIVFMEYLSPYTGELGDPLSTISKIRKYLYQGQETNIEPSLLETLKKLETIKHKWSGCGFDIHEGNVMQRPDGTIVITDPMASYQDDAD